MKARDFNWIKVVFLAFASMIAIVTFANQRTVSIPLAAGMLELTNGSNVPVAYTVTCYGSSSGQQATNFSYTLQPRAYTNYAFSSGTGSVGCSVGSAYYTSSGSNFLVCGTWTNYASAASVCDSGANYSLCTISDYTTYVTNPAALYYTAWISMSGLSTNSSFSSDGGTTWTNLGNAYRPAVTDWTGYSLATATAGGGTVHQRCTGISTNSTAYVACCSSSPGSGTGPVKSCDVTITSTNANAFLQSPQYLGNKPF